MSSRVASLLAWAICGLTLALSACTIMLSVLNSYDLSPLSVAEAPVALIGGLVVSRRPANAVVWIIEGHALCFTLGEFTRQYAIFGLLTEPGAAPFARVMASPLYWIWAPASS